MGIKTIITCDCCGSTLIPESCSCGEIQRKIKLNDWLQIGLTKQAGYFEYCDTCWPTAKQKLLDKEVQYREL